jgi:hypothetical protein
MNFTKQQKWNLTLKCDCDQIFISVFFPMIVKLFFSHDKLYDDEVRIWPPLKSAILESSSVRESVKS